jgi:hypothetical protein
MIFPSWKRVFALTRYFMVHPFRKREGESEQIQQMLGRCSPSR